MSDYFDFINFANDKAIELGADLCQAKLAINNVYELNADNRALTLLRTFEKISLGVSVVKNKRKGAVQISKLDKDTIVESIKNAINNTTHVPSDEALDIYPYREPENYSLGDSKPDTEVIFAELQDFIKELKTEFPKIRLTNTINSFNYTQYYFGNSNGLRLSAQTGLYSFTIMFMAKDNHKATSFNYVVTLKPQPLKRLIEIEQVNRNLCYIERSLNPRPIPENFNGEVIFTPESCETFIGVLLGSLSGSALFAKNTPYLNSIGEMIASPELTIVGNPSSHEYPNASPFGSYGVPMTKFPIITKGRLDNYLIDFYYGNKLERPVTCDGEPGIEVKPGHITFEELVANTERGILLGRFSGGNPNANLDFSGIAKNSFYIEKGKILYPLTETMIAGNLQNVLKSIKGISMEQTTYMTTGNYPFLACTGVDISTGNSSVTSGMNFM